MMHTPYPLASPDIPTTGPMAEESPSPECIAMPPPWSIYLWPTVFCQANRTDPTNFVHLGTRILGGVTEPGLLTGQTMWSERRRQQEAGLLWDWAEIRHGVLALTDPMGVVTNLRMVTDQGRVLTSQEAALHLNLIVHGIAWQGEVWRATRRLLRAQ
jgi:hypothetical protein